MVAQAPLTSMNFGFCPQCVHAFLLVFILNVDCSCLIPYPYDRNAFCEIGIEFLNISNVYRSFRAHTMGPLYRRSVVRRARPVG
jgi:hypothetical protein